VSGVARTRQNGGVDVTASSLSPRRVTRQISVGSVKVGGDAPISVQSMTTTKTADVDGTLQQIYALAANGADIVRCTCNDQAAAEGLAQIVPRSPVPIVADIHFHVEMALAALDAGVNGLRLNPGNLRKAEEIKLVASEARDRGVPIRIGVNAGSLHPDIYKRFGGATPEALVESARIELAYFEEVDFTDVKISVKASSVATMIAAYRLASQTFDHPLHLGVTEAGPLPGGLLKGTAGIATLLAEGIGDTLRYSLTADPVEEARAGRQLLESLGLRERKGLDLIACPSCGRAEVDVIKVANEAQEALNALDVPLQVAVMGCVVNGPGEARHADLGIAAGKHRGHLFIQGQIVRVVREDEMVEALVDEAKKIIAEGIEARLLARDVSAEAEAEADRAELLDDRGMDVNHTQERIEKIRRHVEQ
jgi:(E)-4-hydroxy-3-methylbut-2-enyl-diphosphate synthase